MTIKNIQSCRKFIYSDDFKLLIVGLKNEILLIFAISFAFFGMRKDVNEPKMVVSSKCML